MHIVDANYRASSLPQTSGYGFAAYPADKQALYTDAASAIYEAVSSGIVPQRDEVWKRRCNNLMRLFGSVSSQGDASWFVNSEMLGHPSPEIAGGMIGILNKISWAIKEQKPGSFANAVEEFNKDHGDEMLDSYLDVALRGEQPIVESEWAYVLWSKNPNRLLRVGATAADLRTLANEMNRRVSSANPVGILAAWPVNDADDARITIANTLREYRAADGYYFVNLGVAKEIVEAGLKATDNFVLSPFHVEDEPASTPTVAMRA
ncbi:hypothetical protein OIU34_18605 [Pararhizobium sp. BT-229]|uniref:hypothetical protein n=1 Tax=Pararhizobium sp. BT-229 TaxID=2986923 RepID=UPI0021F7AFC9|nr:hypothetical protein [Pararhizobium sp. BT-229]MCV9963891.1 hypothetical protein [Pararhizobium sp. BT-229]